MEYRVIRSEDYSDNYMEHAWGNKNGAEKGSSWKNHAYLARQWINNKWRYAYNQAQVKAMNAWGKGRQAAKQVSDTLSGRYAQTVRNREASGTRMRDAGTERIMKGDKGGKRQADIGAHTVNKAREEKQSLRYKISDIMGSGLNSETLRPFVNAGKSAAKSVLGGAKGIANSTLSEVGNYARKGKSAVSNVLNKAKGVAQDPKDWIDTKVENAGKAVKDARKAAGEAAGRVLTKAGLQDEYDTAKTAVRSGAGAVKGAVENVAGKVRGIAQDPKDWIDTKVERVGAAVSKATTDAKNKASEVYGDVNKALTDAKSSASSLASSVQQFTKNSYRYATDSDYRALSKEVRAASNRLNTLNDMIDEIESTNTDPTRLPEGYNQIYALKQERNALEKQIERAQDALDEYDK